MAKNDFPEKWAHKGDYSSSWASKKTNTYKKENVSIGNDDNDKKFISNTLLNNISASTPKAIVKDIATSKTDKKQTDPQPKSNNHNTILSKAEHPKKTNSSSVLIKKRDYHLIIMLLILIIVLVALCIIGVIFFTKNDRLSDVLEDNTNQLSANVSVSDNRNIITSKITESIEVNTNPNTSSTGSFKNSIELNNYIGFWHTNSNNDEELTIHSVSEIEVDFSLWCYRTFSFENIKAHIENNSASFNKRSGNDYISGTISFFDGSVILEISNCNINEIESNVTIVFSDKTNQTIKESIANRGVISEISPIHAKLIGDGTIIGYDTSFVVDGGAMKTVRTDLKKAWHVITHCQCVNHDQIYYECYDGDDGDYYGWIPEKNLIIDNEVFNAYTIKIKNSKLYIYDSPGYVEKIVGQITDSGTYTIVDEFVEPGKSASLFTWGKLKSNAGWINLYDSQIDDVYLESGVTGSVAIQDGTLNVRETPDINAKVIGSLLKGDTVIICGEYGKWLEIDFKGSIGYVYAEYIIINNKQEPTTVIPPTTYEVSSDTRTDEITTSLDEQSGLDDDGVD